MKPICCDTSFLFSFYGQDAHPPRAKAVMERLTMPLANTSFNEYEFLNAIHLAVFRSVLAADNAKALQEDFQEDIASGKWVRPACDLAGVLIEAKRISAAHTSANGYRAFDVLHVAAACYLEASEILSFDTNQRALATAEDLSVNL